MMLKVENEMEDEKKILEQAELVFKIFSGSAGPEVLNVEDFRGLSQTNALKDQVVRGFCFRILYFFFF